MINKFVMAVFLMGFVWSINAATEATTTEIETVKSADCRTTDQPAVSLLDKMIVNDNLPLTNELAASSCHQCYVDHQVCLQIQSRPFCRQKLADCREDCY